MGSSQKSQYSCDMSLRGNTLENTPHNLQFPYIYYSHIFIAALRKILLYIPEILKEVTQKS